MTHFSRFKFAWIILFALAASLALGFQDRPNWEYKVLNVEEKQSGQYGWVVTPSEADLNALGKQGWELVASSIAPGTMFNKLTPALPSGVIDHNKDMFVSNVHAQSLILIFKRQIMPNPIIKSNAAIRKP